MLKKILTITLVLLILVCMFGCRAKSCSHNSVTMIDENTHKCDIKGCQKVLEHIINPETEKCACGYHVHRYSETGLTAKCEICGEIQDHTCSYDNDICTECGENKPVSFTVTSGNRAAVGYTGVEGENLVIPATFIGDGTNDTTEGTKYQVTSIRDEAFDGCQSLTSVTIPDSVVSIGDHAFSWCTSLTSVTIPDSVTNIGAAAFYMCTSLTSVNIPDGVTSIGYGTFRDCYSLTDITIPDSVTKIGNLAFYFCESLTSIAIPNNVTDVGIGVFGGCPNLTSIHVDTNNTKYDNRNNCNAIVETATNTLIAGCKNTVIPDSVTSLGGHAFYYCTSLTSITIPDSVTSIGNSAFAFCDLLTSVTVGKGVTSIGEEAFEECTSLTSINYTGTKAQWNVILKGTYWEYHVPITIVHCTDGCFDLNGTQIACPTHG